MKTTSSLTCSCIFFRDWVISLCTSIGFPLLYSAFVLTRKFLYRKGPSSPQCVESNPETATSFRFRVERVITGADAVGLSAQDRILPIQRSAHVFWLVRIQERESGSVRGFILSGDGHVGSWSRDPGFSAPHRGHEGKRFANARCWKEDSAQGELSSLAVVLF
jgi:hypothetical protein